MNDYKYLRECMEAIGSHTFLLGLYLSPVAKHIVPSFPPTQYKYPSLGTATPAEDLREAMECVGTNRLHAFKKVLVIIQTSIMV